jgi:riboflavin synthase
LQAVITIFTGIIEETGTISRIKRGSNSCSISINCSKVVDDVRLGDSIAVNGVCLTVVEYSKNHFTADVMPETFAKTTLNTLAMGSLVNLERALRVGDRLGGHMVQGHVDGIGTILERQTYDIAVIFRIAASPEIIKYIVAKGSITIDGISLTVVEVLKDSFTVSLIPHTAMITTLGQKQPGDRVNLETDIIARYVERFLAEPERPAQGKVDVRLLAEHGFL